MANLPLLVAAKDRWEEFDSRERLVLKLLAIAFTAVVAYFAIWQPAKDFMESQAAHQARSEDLLQLIRTNRQKLASLNQNSGRQAASMNSQQLVSTVTNMANKNGLSLKRFEPSGDSKVKVWVEKASFDKLVGWLAQLEKSLKIRVEQISVEKEDAPGTVSARLTLSS